MADIHLLQGTGTEIIQMEIILILSLLLITGVAWLEGRFRFPYTVALVFAGLLLALSSNLFNSSLGSGEIQISTELILAFFVPPLIFEGALHINWRIFRSNLVIILLMAVPGVLLSTFIIGGLTINIVDGMATLAQKLNIHLLVGAGGVVVAEDISLERDPCGVRGLRQHVRRDPDLGGQFRSRVAGRSVSGCSFVYATCRIQFQCVRDL